MNPMAPNFCSGRGLLGQSRRPIPDAPDVFAYPGRSDVVLCSNVRCSRCGLQVRSNNGLTVAGGLDVLPSAYGAKDPLTVDGVSYGVGSQRLYFCNCAYYVAGGVVSLAMVHELPQLALPRTWACGGHPVLSLPTQVGGIDLPVEPDWAQLIRTTFRLSIDPARPRASVHWLQGVYGVLTGTPHPARIDNVIQVFLSSSDSVIRGQALHFLWSPMSFPATDKLPELVLEDAETLRSQPDPLAHYADLYDIAVCALAFHIDRGRLPYAGAIQQAIRAHAATPGRLAGVGWLFQARDKAWFIEHVDALLESSPDAAESVARWRRVADIRDQVLGAD